jgi:hypothetical protein
MDHKIVTRITLGKPVNGLYPERVCGPGYLDWLRCGGARESAYADAIEKASIPYLLKSGQVEYAQRIHERHT